MNRASSATVEPPASHGPGPNAGAALQTHTIGVLPLSSLGLLVGIVAGLGALVFRGLIGIIHSILFLGRSYSFFYDTPLVGDFKNAGGEWRPKGTPEEVQVHDFMIQELGRAVPYGVYDLAANAGWVSVGVNNDDDAFAVETVRRWWYGIGRIRDLDAKYLLITADGGGSNRVHGCACGNVNCIASPPSSASKSRSVTCRQASANGTRSSIVCSRISVRTGAPCHWCELPGHR